MENEDPLPAEYLAVMPKKKVYHLFMNTIEQNLSALQKAKNLEDLTAKLNAIFPELKKPDENKLHVTFEKAEHPSEDGDGAFAHGGFEPPIVMKVNSKTKKREPKMKVNPKTKELEPIIDKAEGSIGPVFLYVSDNTLKALQSWTTKDNFGKYGERTGKRLFKYTALGTLIHEFIHQQQWAQKIYPEESPDGEGLDKLLTLSGYTLAERGKMNILMPPIINVLISRKFLENEDLSGMPNEASQKNYKEIRGLMNRWYFGNSQEFPGWAQGLAADLIDLEIPEDEMLKIAAALKTQTYDQVDERIKEHSLTRYFTHPNGFLATYPQGNKRFFEIAEEYVKSYIENELHK